MLIEQVIYTAGDEEKKPINGLHGSNGYRVIAISSGLAGEKKLLEFLENWHYPIGIIRHEEIKSETPFKSLLFFKQWVIYTTCIVAAFSHDGRSGTLYSQHMILTKEQFEKIDNDTRYLDLHFKEYFHNTRYVPAIIVPTGPAKLYHKLDKSDIPYNEKIVEDLQKKRKIGILSKYRVNMQELLALVDPEFRLIEWCNVIYEPNRQWLFRFVCGEWHIKYKLKGRWKIYDFDR